MLLYSFISKASEPISNASEPKETDLAKTSAPPEPGSVEDHAGAGGPHGSPSDADVASTFTQRGGATIGLSSWKGFMTLSASRDIIRLDIDLTFPREWVFPKEKIRRLSKYRSFPHIALRIEHTVEGYPGVVVFYASQFDALKRGLESLGYEVWPEPSVSAKNSVEAWFGYFRLEPVYLALCAAGLILNLLLLFLLTR